MKVWITKYALSVGIVETEARLVTSGSQCIWARMRFNEPEQYFLEKEYWLSFEDGKADAEQRRNAKIASLTKQIAKLERMEF